VAGVWLSLSVSFFLSAACICMRLETIIKPTGQLGRAWRRLGLRSKADLS
jgi:hypothetical protein